MNSKSLSVIIFLLAVIFFAGNISFAQRNSKSDKTPEQIAEKRAGKMKQYLSLTDDQYKQVYDLTLQKVNYNRENREKLSSMDKESRKQFKSQNREEYKKQLENILNTEQIAKFQQMKKYHKNNHKKDKSDKNLNNRQ